MIFCGIEVEIVRKKIKNMHLYVIPPDGRVRVSVPEKIGDNVIRMFLQTRYEWILKQRQIIAEQPRLSEREYITGEAFYVFGKQYYLQVEYSNKCNSLRFQGNRAILTVRKESTAKQRENYVNEWYRNLLKIELAKVVMKWEEITGLHVNEWTIKNMTTRWGSCITEKKKIIINLQLVKKTRNCLDYVVLHELSHFVSRKHDQKFVAYVEKYMPFWKEVRKSLNDQILDYLPVSR